ncbi:uncharacterized protein (TIGR03083 family) [Jatrophihabitans sp. GAS493]|uniref:sterol carrier family protein n=1 Tax=Jatrophihabitans sp. GAS493 TaxID=1907575 RepID=UPI000BB67B7B|nr:sterol carrier family protein [Jatrophihabitans sp. GAS493]SOD71625.1 uncharacterized protein (TIGR03083 family) [Jatrophihabitans sp. GAS493]
MSRKDGQARPESAYAATADAFVAQWELTLQWLERLAPESFSVASVLPEWDVRQLTAHLILVRRGLVERLTSRSDEAPTPLPAYLRRYQDAAGHIGARTDAVADDRTPQDLLTELRSAPDPRPQLSEVGPATVLRGGRGPIRADDWLLTRLIELVVHSDDLSQSLPGLPPIQLQRSALATVTRTLAEMLVREAPGRSVEVRVPPFVAVQAISGPRHTRGTPPNVVEMSPLVWMRLAAGRIGWDAVAASGAVRASGSRASLAEHLPLFT